jgi:hypothetical protein
MSMQDERLKELGMVTPQLSKAKAIDNLSTPQDKAAMTLSVLTTKDLPRFNLIFAINDMVHYEWLKNSVYNELLLRASTNRKGKRGRDDLVNVSMDKVEDKGALASFKERISSFFSSGS